MIWIDFENTPHVPFFAPIIERLVSGGYECILTSREFAQTNALLERFGLHATSIGGEYGSNTLRKAIGIFARARALRKFIKNKDVTLAIGHGSRGLLIASKLARIPSLTLYDYEGASIGLFNRFSTRVMTPEVVGKRLLKDGAIKSSKLLTYPGLKEETYVRSFVPDEKIYSDLGLDREKIIITVRPPSATAHYRSQESDNLFKSTLERLIAHSGVQVVISARTKDQRAGIKQLYGTNENVRVPEQTFDGLNLLYHSDLVIGGGGTMNREAAVLGVPVLSIFKGKQGEVDAELVRSGKMVEIANADEVLPFLKKRSVAEPQTSNATLEAVLQAIERLAGPPGITSRRG